MRCEYELVGWICDVCWMEVLMLVKYKNMFDVLG